MNAMHIDAGLGFIILAVLVFYLRLIIIQRQRVKRVPGASRRGRERRQADALQALERLSIISKRRRDWVIAGLGAVAILLGAIAYASPQFVLKNYYWLPIGFGIVALSWAFR